MKSIIVLCGNNCGYCKKARMLIKHALEKNTKYLALDIQFLYEGEENGFRLNHSMLPAFYVGKKLFYEGNPTADIISAMLERSYKD